MERNELINILESYVEGLINNEVDRIPLHDEVVYSDPIIQAELSGKDEVYEYLADLAGAFGDIQYHIERDIIDGNFVCTVIKLRLSEGQVLDMCCIVEIEDKSLRSVRAYFDPTQIM